MGFRPVATAAGAEEARGQPGEGNLAGNAPQLDDETAEPGPAPAADAQDHRSCATQQNGHASAAGGGNDGVRTRRRAQGGG